MKSVCLQLKDSFKNNLLAEWLPFLQNFEEFKKTKKAISSDILDTFQKTIAREILDFSALLERILSTTPNGKIVEYKVENSDDLEGRTWHVKLALKLSVRKNRSYGMEKINVKVGDVLDLAEGIVINTRMGPIKATKQNPIKLTVLGFKLETNQLVASYQAKIMLGLKTSINNVLLEDSEVLRLLKI